MDDDKVSVLANKKENTRTTQHANIKDGIRMQLKTEEVPREEDKWS